MDIIVSLWFSVLESILSISRSGITGSYGSCISSFWQILVNTVLALMHILTYNVAGSFPHIPILNFHFLQELTIEAWGDFVTCPGLHNEGSALQSDWTMELNPGVRSLGILFRVCALFILCLMKVVCPTWETSTFLHCVKCLHIFSFLSPFYHLLPSCKLCPIFGFDIGSCFVAQSSPELATLFLYSPEYWDHRNVPSRPVVSIKLSCSVFCLPLIHPEVLSLFPFSLI